MPAVPAQQRTCSLVPRLLGLPALPSPQALRKSDVRVQSRCAQGIKVLTPSQGGFFPKFLCLSLTHTRERAQPSRHSLTKSRNSRSLIPRRPFTAYERSAQQVPIPLLLPVGFAPVGDFLTALQLHAESHSK
ncbi:hypothetical protein CORC01_11825 [Colletotrichum orchidophilum]|uniref:Uncharacterized protein n=1 Tax=Colletotrichum orchidophilum TaxID=1209926 RepID=A0A1G4AUX7_9PEZI|nr:uncharacterized protein CORC01_11825 [Colletotrichum orchidophilum]OHE92883.1 hypothetical protein CORC01_11825 [Colletotrichum orchidophilum]